MRLVEAIGGIVVIVAAVELWLRRVNPVADPYERFKRLQTPNRYIPSEFPPKARVAIEVEAGLPGLRPGRRIFTTNNLGLRGDELLMPKPSGEIRVFLTGDSVAECLFLEDQQAISGVLQHALAGAASDGCVVKVYNAARSHDASDDQLSLIVHRLLHLQPDLIVLCLGVGELLAGLDGRDPLHRVDGTGTRHSFLRLLRLVATELQIFRRLFALLSGVPASSIRAEEVLHSRCREKAAHHRQLPLAAEPPRVNLAMFTTNLRTIAGSLKAHGVPLVFMTQQATWNSLVDPGVRQWHWRLGRRGWRYREADTAEALEAINEAIRQCAASQEVPVYDFSRIVPKSREFFYDDVHVNAKGAEAAGKGLAGFIVEQGLLSAPAAR